MPKMLQFFKGVLGGICASFTKGSRLSGSGSTICAWPRDNVSPLQGPLATRRWIFCVVQCGERPRKSPCKWWGWSPGNDEGFGNGLIYMPLDLMIIEIFGWVLDDTDLRATLIAPCISCRFQELMVLCDIWIYLVWCLVGRARIERRSGCLDVALLVKEWEIMISSLTSQHWSRWPNRSKKILQQSGMMGNGWSETSCRTVPSTRGTWQCGCCRLRLI